MNNTITILYSSGGGNTKLVVDKISELLEQAGWEPELINAVTASPDDLTKRDITILAGPTYDHGVLHKPYEKLLDQAEAQQVNLSDHYYAIVGLGDDKYDKEYNIESADILTKFVTNHNGTIITDGLLVNKSPVDQLNDLVATWTKNLLDHLANDAAKG